MAQKSPKAQLRWVSGKIEEHPLALAWEMFHEDKDILKISWESPNGKRLRVAQIDPIFGLLKAVYIEDLMEDALNEADKEGI